MSNKKILHVIYRLSPSSGAEKQVYNISLSQKKMGYDVHINVYIWCKKCKKLSDAGIKIYNINSNRYFSLRSTYLLFKKQNFINPQISISWTPTLDFFLFICSYLNKVPFIINERTSYLCYEKFYLKDYKGKLLKTSITHNYLIFIFFRILRFFSLSFSESIITNSLHMRNYYKKKFSSKKIIQINNIINKSNNNKIFLNKSFTFLVVSRFTESKNINLVIEAFKLLRKKHKTSKLVIVGKGYDFKNSMKLIDSKIKPYVKVYKNLENWNTSFDKNKTYLIHPSFYEGQPNVLLEAAYSKIPIVISKIPAHTDIFTFNSCLYFDPFNLADLYSKMVLCLNESNINKQKRIRLAKKKLRSFSNKSVINKYNKLLSLN